MDSLTKENFWNDLYEEYPSEMKHFCDWIDEYKKNNNWSELFAKGERTDITPKYHNLPIAMQIGIFIQYVAESDTRHSIELPLIESKEDFENIKYLITQFFFHEKVAAIQDKNDLKYS